MLNNQITPSNNQFYFFARENLENAFRLAKIFYESGCFANVIQNAQQVLIILMAGAELGLKPIESMNCFYFLKGSLRIYGFGLSKILSRAGISFTFHTLNKKEVDVSYYKNGQLLQRLRYTIEDLKELKNNNNQSYNILDKYPEEKLVYHAHSRFLRYYDVGASIPLADYDQEAIDSIDEEDFKNEIAEPKTQPKVELKTKLKTEPKVEPKVELKTEPEAKTEQANKQEKTDNPVEVEEKNKTKAEDLLNKLTENQKQAVTKLAEAL